MPAGQRNGLGALGTRGVCVYAHPLGDELGSPPPCQWHRMPTTQETDGFQVKRPGDLNVKCTLLLMLDHQVTNALGSCLESQNSSGGQGQVPVVNISCPCPIPL